VFQSNWILYLVIEEMQLGELEAYIRWMRVSTAISHNLRAEEGEKRTGRRISRGVLLSNNVSRQRRFTYARSYGPHFHAPRGGILKFVRDYAQP